MAGCRLGRENRKRNVILIVADDLGYGELGCYGQKLIKTPNLDRLASEGLRFTQAYAGSSVCAPSRCCLFTGYHTGNAWVRGNNSERHLPQGTGTLGTLMQQAGYSTGLFGKWDLGPNGTSGAANLQGFEQFFGYDNLVSAHNYWPAYLLKNEEKVYLNNEVNSFPVYYSDYLGGVATTRNEYAPDVIANAAFEFVATQKQPFFLAWTPLIPHANNEAGNDGMEVPSQGIYADKDWPEAQKNHAAMISLLDQHVGQLMDLLQERDLVKDTLVLFMSDNGPHSEGGADPQFFDGNAHLRGQKRDLYEGGIRVPFLAWGGDIPPGRVVETPIALWDLWATFAHISGANVPPRDGVPIPYLTRDARPPQEDRPFYWEFHELPKCRAIRQGEWKLIHFFQEGRIELFNLAEDPSEERNIAPQQTEVVQKLMVLMDSLRSPSDLWDID